MHTCENCWKSFSYGQNLTRHILSKSCTRASAIKKIISDSKKSDLIYICNFGCTNTRKYSKEFTTTSGLLSHYRRSCSKVPENLKTILCPRLINRSNLTSVPDAENSDMDFLFDSLSDLENIEQGFANELAVEQETETAPIISEDSKILAKYGIIIYENYQIIQCGSCERFLGETFFNHVPCKKGGLKITFKDLAFLKESVVPKILTSEYYSTAPVNRCLERIPFLELVNGLTCFECGFCCVNLKTMKRHTKNSHSRVNFGRCKLQSLCNASKKNKKYFSVDERLHPNIRDFDEEKFIRRLQNQGQDSIKSALISSHERPFFYDSAGWFSSNDPMNENAPLYLVNWAEMSVDENELYVHLKIHYSKMMKDVSKAPAVYRSLVGDENSGKLINIIAYPEDYIDLFSKVILFICRLSSLESQNFVTFDDRLLIIINELKNNNFSNLYIAGFYIISQEPPQQLGSLDMLSLFVKLSSRDRVNETYHTAQFIERICGKLIYFSKLNCLHLLMNGFQSDPASSAVVTIDELTKNIRDVLFNSVTAHKSIVLLYGLAGSKKESIGTAFNLTETQNPDEVNVNEVIVSFKNVALD